MKGMFGKFIATATMVAAMLLSSNVEAQSRVVVKRNGKTIIRVVMPRQQCETPRRLPARPYRNARRDTQRHFRHMRHVHRFYNARNHARNRCTFCIRYERWRDRGRHTRCGYDRIRHVYVHRH